MSGHDWLSLAEIARLWSNETGESEETLERDLDAWFSEFVARQPTEPSGMPGQGGDTTNLLMGMLGGRHLQREIFAVCCEEKGYAKPKFWFSGDTQDSEADPPPPSDPASVARLQALHGFAPKADPGQRQPAQCHPPQPQNEKARPKPSERRAEWWQPEAESGPESGYDASDTADRWPPPNAYWAPPEPASPSLARSAPAAVWRAMGRFLPYLAIGLLALARALLRAGRGLPGGNATRLAGGLVLVVTLLSVMIILGQDETAPSQPAPNAAGPEEAPEALMSALRRELAAALQTIASLEQEALQKSAALPDAARRELDLAAQAASAHAALLGRDLDAARRRIADLEVQIRAAGAEAARLAKQLAVVRKAHKEDLEKFRPAAEVPATKPDPQSAPAPSGTAKVTAVSVSPQDAKLETAVARPKPIPAAETVDVDSLVTSPGRYDEYRVVVTSSLFRLLQQYRLESRLGRKSLVVDVTGLQRTQHDLLQQAIAGTGVMSTVRAQISGRVVRGSGETYRLLATDLVLLE
jgi:hypothetical protein